MPLVTPASSRRPIRHAREVRRLGRPRRSVRRELAGMLLAGALTLGFTVAGVGGAVLGVSAGLQEAQAEDVPAPMAAAFAPRPAQGG